MPSWTNKRCATRDWVIQRNEYIIGIGTSLFLSKMFAINFDVFGFMIVTFIMIIFSPFFVGRTRFIHLVWFGLVCHDRRRLLPVLSPLPNQWMNFYSRFASIWIIPSVPNVPNVPKCSALSARSLAAAVCYAKFVLNITARSGSAITCTNGQINYLLLNI